MMRAPKVLVILFIISTHYASPAAAHTFRGKGDTVNVASSGISITPGRDWNRLDGKPGKNVEVWTLDGEQLNEVTFYGGIEPGQPLIKERDKKREPLPRLESNTLILDIPELLQNTYRASRKISSFTVLSSIPDTFMGHAGTRFIYQYTDQNTLPRKGEARAILVNQRLYMVTFDAPRLYYFDRTLEDFRALTGSAKTRRLGQSGNLFAFRRSSVMLAFGN